ncbi:MAG: hypothetical protein A3C88_01630 [Candidatus Yanofskybacteria bacterium RIFCSPHIGHO2_02_FULL_50_12]|uniref:Uncharacterized protein n=1 Tax=Candidatus Yanofskybacteria bacterium RIFCSPHIGHO2_02_FULL_50_12 TaxID=1802685 RepID=A0A1F8FWA3_9BACT|nr:MAG: hypothetical protein A3C88_01630 [Candidatus Yanofskybacteria bacterium RIFCSPHIGHO2_02_FULL_50_12]
MLAVIFAFTFSAHAEEPTPTHGSKPVRQTVKPAIRKEVQDIKKETQNTVREIKTEAKQDIRAIKEERKVDPQAVRADLEEKRKELKSQIETKRKEAQTRIKAKEAELKERLTKIKDERKVEAVKKIDKNIDALNQRMLNHFANSLEKLSSILNRIAERASKAETAGADVSTVRADIDAATNAIAKAKEAIAAQAGKTYTIEVATEEGLKQAVQRARQALHADLKVVKDSVKAAGEAVRKAAVDLGKVPRQSPTNSPQATPSE